MSRRSRRMSTLFVYVLECEGAVRVHTCGMRPDAQARGLNAKNRQYQNEDFGVGGSFFFLTRSAHRFHSTRGERGAPPDSPSAFKPSCSKHMFWYLGSLHPQGHTCSSGWKLALSKVSIYRYTLIYIDIYLQV